MFTFIVVQGFLFRAEGKYLDKCRGCFKKGIMVNIFTKTIYTVKQQELNVKWRQPCGGGYSDVGVFELVPFTWTCAKCFMLSYTRVLLLKAGEGLFKGAPNDRMVSALN